MCYEFWHYVNVPLVAATQKLFYCSKLLTFAHLILLNYKVFRRCVAVQKKFHPKYFKSDIFL